jgi:hypothetical protein
MLNAELRNKFRNNETPVQQIPRATSRRTKASSRSLAGNPPDFYFFANATGAKARNKIAGLLRRPYCDVECTE